MQFLNESWSNLVDADEEKIRNQQATLNDSLAAEADIDHQIDKEVYKLI